MDISRLQTLFDALRPLRIAVIGDHALDAYWSIDMSASEVSVETGLPTIPITSQAYFPGGASNVAANLAALGVGTVHALGVVGDDPFGPFLRTILERASVDCRDLLIQESEWDTQVFGKPHRSGTEESRIDWGNQNRLSDGSAAALIERLEERILGASAVIINQQAFAGIHSHHTFRSRLAELVSHHSDKVIVVDSRHFPGTYPAALRKINAAEGIRAAGLPEASPPDDAVARHAAELLAARWRAIVFLTLGRGGCIVARGGTSTALPAIPVSGPIDPVGAGDSFLAGAVAALAAGWGAEDAARIGILAAAVTVRTLYRPGTATPADILDLAVMSRSA